MRVHIHRNEDETLDLWAEPTRRGEGPHYLVKGIPPSHLEHELAMTINAACANRPGFTPLAVPTLPETDV
jgi:hypothetical protein